MDPCDFSFEYVFPTGPSIKKRLASTETSCVFDGYFRIESELPTKFPIRRIFYKGDVASLVQITDIRRGENTSHYFYDEGAEGMICLTPTEIIELQLVVLEANLSSERAHALHADIWVEEKELRAANEACHTARMEKEHAEWKRNRSPQ